jgi:hypothetical protein
MDWIYVAQDRDKWRALVETVMDLRVFCKCCETFEQLSDCQDLVSQLEFTPRTFVQLRTAAEWSDHVTRSTYRNYLLKGNSWIHVPQQITISRMICDRFLNLFGAGQLICVTPGLQ